MQNVREFTKHDWMAFAGAENWPVIHDLTADECEPIIAEGKNKKDEGTMVLVDKKGILAMVEHDPQGEYGGYTLEIQFPTQILARAFMEGFSEDFNGLDLMLMGFKTQ